MEDPTKASFSPIEVAEGMIDNSIFGFPTNKSRELTQAFPILMFLKEKDIVEMLEKEVAFYYEERKCAFPGSINGMPMFFSVRYLNVEETRAMYKHWFGRLRELKPEEDIQSDEEIDNIINEIKEGLVKSLEEIKSERDPITNAIDELFD